MLPPQADGDDVCAQRNFFSSFSSTFACQKRSISFSFLHLTNRPNNLKRAGQQELRAGFDKDKELHPNNPKLLLSIAVPAGQDNIDNGFDVQTISR